MAMEESMKTLTSTSTSEFSSEEVMSSYSSSTISTTTSSTTVLTTKELNALISETKLNESFLDANCEDLEHTAVFPLGKPTFRPHEEVGIDPDAFPRLKIDEDEQLLARTNKNKILTSAVKSIQCTCNGVGTPPTTPTKIKSSGIQNQKMASKEHSYLAGTISSERKSLGTFPLPCRSPSPNLRSRTPDLIRSPEPEIVFSTTEIKTDEFATEQVEQESPCSTPKLEFKSALKLPEKNVRPNSLQIPIEKDFAENISSKGATKCPAARKISFESSESTNFGKIITKSVKSTQKSEKQTDDTEKQFGKTSECEPLLEIKEEYQGVPSKLSKASQTRPCIVTPISAIKSLSANQAVHRHNLFVFSNRTPSFLRSTESSRQHSISPPRVIEEVKYLKDTSFLSKKSSSLPCVASPPGPRRSQYQSQVTKSPSRKYVFGSSSPARSNLETQIIQQQIRLMERSPSPSQKYCAGQTMSPSLPVTKHAPETPSKLSSTSAAKCTTFSSNSNFSKSPSKISTSTKKGSDSGQTYFSSHMNSSTYVSPTPLASFSGYADRIESKSPTKTAIPKKLAPSKIMVTSISPAEAVADQKLFQRSNSFNYYNGHGSGSKITTEKFSSLTRCSSQTTSSSSLRRGTSPADRRVSEFALRSQVVIKEPPCHHRHSVCSNVYNGQVRMNSLESASSLSMSPVTPSSPKLSGIKGGGSRSSQPLSICTPHLPQYYSLERCSRKSVK